MDRLLDVVVTGAWLYIGASVIAFFIVVPLILYIFYKVFKNLK